MDFANYWFQAAGVQPSYQIGNSLRFRGAQYLSRTPSTAGNLNTWSTSFWLKAEANGDRQEVFTCRFSSTDQDGIELSATGQTDFYNFRGGTYRDRFLSNALHRDPGAWWHWLCVFDTTNPNLADAMRYYVNGERVTSFATENTPTANFNGLINNTYVHYIGIHSNKYCLNGYLAEFHHIDGATHDPTDFGEFNADGVWVPKTVSGVTYGTNGFYLDFSDPADIGADRSGNGNNFTPTGFELTDTTSTSYDWMADSPTDNYPTVNFLSISNQGNSSQLAFTNANLMTAATSVNYYVKPSTVGVSSGKWYWEGSIKLLGDTSGAQGAANIGVVADGFNPNDHIGIDANGWAYNFDGQTLHNAVAAPYGAGFIQGSVIGIALDMDAKTITFYKDGVSQGQAFSGLADEVFPAWSASSTAGFSPQWYVNHGQLPFAHTPPAGFEPLSTAVLPDVAITNPSEHFTTILDTGANILTNAQATFPNGLWWIKDREKTTDHQLLDSLRGGSLTLSSNLPDKESTYTAPTGSSVAWCWKAGDSNVVNNDGTLQSTVSVNPTAGFSVVTYTGNGVSGSNVGHGLGVKPAFILIKRRSGSSGWIIYHEGVDPTAPEQYWLRLDDASARTKSATMFNNTAPTSTVFTVGDGNSVNNASGTHVAYCFANVEGYSKFGTYVGNGSTDGPFVHCGFKPAWVLLKRYNAISSYWLIDSARDTYNVAQHKLRLDNSSAERIDSVNQIDILSNGFKLRDTTASSNINNGKFVFMAFAEHPFGGGNVSPSPAR